MSDRIKDQKKSKLFAPARVVRLHGRLAASAALGLAVLAGLAAADLRLSTRLLLAWDVGVICYLVLVFVPARLATVAQIRRRAAEQDEGAVVLLVLTAAAAVASLAAIVAQLGRVPGAAQADWRGIALGMATIVLSWLFVHTMFALHYAHEFYGEGRDRRIGGLEFPGDHDPDYWDFVYFSFVIAMTSQVSDVQVTGRLMRRLVNVHGVLSFFFNLSVLALTVNMISNLINPG